MLVRLPRPPRRPRCLSVCSRVGGESGAAWGDGVGAGPGEGARSSETGHGNVRNEIRPPRWSRGQTVFLLYHLDWFPTWGFAVGTADQPGWPPWVSRALRSAEHTGLCPLRPAAPSPHPAQVWATKTVRRGRHDLGVRTTGRRPPAPQEPRPGAGLPGLHTLSVSPILSNPVSPSVRDGTAGTGRRPLLSPRKGPRWATASLPVRPGEDKPLLCLGMFAWTDFPKAWSPPGVRPSQEPGVAGRGLRGDCPPEGSPLGTSVLVCPRLEMRTMLFIISLKYRRVQECRRDTEGRIKIECLDKLLLSDLFCIS